MSEAGAGSGELLRGHLLVSHSKVLRPPALLLASLDRGRKGGLQKTKKRLVVLREDGSIQVYESEKHLKKGTTKLVLDLAHTFNLNKKVRPESGPVPRLFFALGRFVGGDWGD